ncbi:Rieske 2Fe-2S domain-containing protein [Pseudomonas sp.]|uniref:Rieske (2Fe-2S) protein n=1 Tax=Pseudomonas sp. TaxID=306 RepID=UPI00262E4E8F|nr:Rieske 2Fe-2S domain-containing protein [Pseudomonas sp.]
MKFLCDAEHLTEAHSRGFEIDGLKLVAVRREGQVFVYRNRCPHRGVPLEWKTDQFLDVSASLIQCATHGALFLIESGECVAGPCAGESLGAISCREDSSGIWITPPAEE